MLIEQEQESPLSFHHDLLMEDICEAPGIKVGEVLGYTPSIAQSLNVIELTPAEARLVELDPIRAPLEAVT